MKIEITVCLIVKKKILENLIMKNYIAVSFALGKSKYDEEEGDEPRDYKIDNNEILKDLDLSLNDDIKVLKRKQILILK